MGRTHKDARVNFSKKENAGRRKDLQRKKDKRMKGSGKNLLKTIDLDSANFDDVDFTLDMA